MKVLANDATIPGSKLERFLLDLVNARVAGTRDDSRHIFGVYSRFLPHPPSTPEEFLPLLPMFAKYLDKDPRKPLPKEQEAYKRAIVVGIRDQLRGIWKAEDEYTAEWQLFHFRSGISEVMGDRSTIGPPSETPLSQALAYLGRKLVLLKRCANRRCETPFFIANRRGQQCCSEKCAAAVRGDKKRRWWRGKRGKPDEGKQPERELARKEGTAKKSKTPAGQPGIAEPALEAFVLDVVNADDRMIDDGTMYFFSRHPAFFPTKDKHIEAMASLASPNRTLVEQLRSELPGIYHRGLIRDLCEGLRAYGRPTTPPRLNGCCSGCAPLCTAGRTSGRAGTGHSGRPRLRLPSNRRCTGSGRTSRN